MKRKLFAIGLAAMLVLVGCGGGGKAFDGAMDNMPASSAPSAPGGDQNGNIYLWDTGGGDVEYAPEAPEPDAPMEPGSSIYQNPGTKLIRRAEMHIQTEQFDQSVGALNQLVTDCGGYFEMASVYGGSHRDAYANRSGEYIVRVPAEKYSQFFKSAGELGYITSSTESSKDVGESYYDTEARLKTQRTKQERLLTLLEKAETMEDIISLENALSDVEYQIEQYSSELNRYDALIGFATIQVYLNEVGQVTKEVGETASLSQRMAAGFQASFRNLGRGFQELLVWGSYNLFLTVILIGVAAAAVIVGKRELKRLKKRGKEDERKEE